MIVVLVVSPVVVHCHAGFPVQAGHTGRRDFLFGCPEIPRELTCFRKSLHSGPPGTHTIVDDDIWLKTSHIVVDLRPILLVPGGFPFSVEPEHADVPVVCQKFLQLILQMLNVAVKVSPGSWPVLLPLPSWQ